MKLLPICINNKFNHMVDFDNNKNVNFVVSADNEGTLLNFFKRNNGVLVQETPSEKIYYVNDVTSNSTADSNVIDINIELVEQIKNQDENKDDKKDSTSIKLVNGYVFEKDSMVVQFPRVNSTTTVNVKFSIGESNCSVTIYLAPSSKIRDVVIDSGSEATQMAMFGRENGMQGVNSICPILNDVYQYFGGGDFENDAINCIQAEVEGNVINDELYKSQFFVRKNNDDNEDINNFNIYGRVDETNSFGVFQMMLQRDNLNEIKESYIQLCNMKIASFNGIQLPRIKVGNELRSIGEVGPDNCFYRKYLNVFIYTVLTRFCNQNNAEVLSIHVLMPNVYSSEDVQKRVDHIIEDTQEMIANNEGFNSHIKGFSVVPVSESDASLIGVMATKTDNNDKQGTYLILDAGKGTLDFSITEIDNNLKFNNLLRNGIVGASAAISYGFLLDLMEEFFREKNIKMSTSREEFMRNFIFETVLGKTTKGVENEGGDVYVLNKLMNAVDAYKIKYSSGRLVDYSETHTDDVILGEDKIKLSTFSDWVENCNMKVPVNNVNAIIDAIVKEFVDKLDISNRGVDNNYKYIPDYVVFSGRGFLFPDFKNRMLNKLRDIFTNIEEVCIDSRQNVNNKNVCLFISQTINAGNYKFQYIPKGNEVVEEPVEQKTNIEKKKVDFRELYHRAHIFFIERGRLPTNEDLPQRPKPSNVENNDVFADGVKIACRPNDIIALGGSLYLIPSDCSESVAVLFYNNGKIVMRYKDNNGEYRVSNLHNPLNIEAGLAFESLFPHAHIDNSNSIKIPVVNVEQEDEKKEEPTMSDAVVVDVSKEKVKEKGTVVDDEFDELEDWWKTK